MRGQQHDASSGALNSGATASVDAVDVVVLSTDEALLGTLHEAAGQSHTIWHARSADAAVDLLVGGRCGILIADLGALGGDAASLLERLQAQFPELVLLATGRRNQESAVAPLITKGSIYRFLHKPVSPARADLFLAAATRRYREMVPSSSASAALATVRQIAQPANRRWLLIVGAALALLVIGLGLSLRTADRAPTVVTAPSQAETSIATQLAAADQAYALGRWVAPPDDNALDRYRAVLAIDPSNAAALAGVQQVLDALELQVTQSLQSRDTPLAARALTSLQKAQPDHPRLETLRQQLLALSRTAAEPVVTAPPVPRKPAVMAAPNTQTARARLTSGQLVDPDNDSALFHLRQARAQDEDDSAIRILATDLGSRLLEDSRQALARGDVEQARARYAQVLDVDREFELGLPELADVGRQIDLASATLAATDTPDLTAILAPIVKLRETGQLLEPAGANAFDSLRALAGQYPEAPEIRAEMQRLAFTLLENGKTALAGGDVEGAERFAARAESLIPGMSAIRSLREQTMAKRAAASAAQPLRASEFRRTREVPAEYPLDARRRGIEGWVDLEFVIGADGTPQDIHVRESRPHTVFDKAATDALRRWRFEPVMRNGEPVVQPATLRMVFELER